MKKIIFFDLDGTLLTKEKRVLLESKEAIKRARENGMEVVICSGRTPSAAKFYQQEAGAGRYVITTNGTAIFDTLEEELLYSCPLEKEFCKSFYDYVIKNDLFFRIDNKYGRYFNQERNRVFDEILFDEEPEKFFEENMILQFSVGSKNSQDIDDTIQVFLKNFPDVKVENRFIASGTADKLEIINVINKNASKGNAVMGLCKYLKISTDDAVAFGDDNNDISMLKVVGHPIAMGNARDEIKYLAKEVASTNNEPGISKILDRFIEENKEL